MTGVLSIPPVLARVSTRSLFRAWNRSRTESASIVTQATRRLESVYPGRSALLVDSGTSALAIALRMAGVGDGKIVALPAFACPDIGTAAQAIQARVVLYDLDPESLEPVLESVDECIRAGASVVVVCHFFGSIVDVSRVITMCASRGVCVVEDAAQHAGGSRHGIRAGALADIGVLSFGRGKGLSASGGGAVLWKSALVQEPTTVSATAHDPRFSWLVPMAEQLLSNPLIYGAISTLPLGLGETRYSPPHGATPMPPFRASLLLEALDDEPAALRDRRAKATRYRQALMAKETIQFVPAEPHDCDGALRVAVRLGNSPSPAAQRLGVVRSYPRGLWEYPELAATIAEQSQSEWPGARTLANSLWTLPTHWRVSADIQTKIIEELSAREGG